MRRDARGLLTATATLAILFAPALALANPYDISLRGLGRPQSTSQDDPAQRRFRLLSTELAFALSPKAMQPAETLGISGFEFSISNSLTQISSKADYWQGQPGEPVFEGVLHDHKVPNVLWTPTAHLRKGLPFSSEIGIQGSYLAYSSMFMLGAEGKIALLESFPRYLPAITARAAVGRLFGSSDIDLLTVEGDVMTSLAFGVGGMAQVTPYLGGGLLMTHINSYVLDETPYSVTDPVNDQRGGSDGSLYTFQTVSWLDYRYRRFFGGLRINVAMIEILGEVNVSMLSPTKMIKSYSLKLGFDV